MSVIKYGARSFPEMRKIVLIVKDKKKKEEEVVKKNQSRSV